jgi:hypothetical protein
MRGDARYAPDGFRYGVRHDDGSVSARWNGRTQRRRVEDEADRLAVIYAPDRIEPVRRAPGGDWQAYRR